MKKKHMNRSEATCGLAAQQTHTDIHPGPGVITISTHDQIATRAYDIYVQSGRKPGHCTHNWQQAEHALRTGSRQP